MPEEVKALASAAVGARAFAAAMPKALRGKIDKIKPRLAETVRKFSAFRTSILAIKDDLLMLLKECQHEAAIYGKKTIGATLAFTEADFARLFDPSVPDHPGDKIIDGQTVEGYRKNPTYQTLRYAINLDRNQNRKGKSGGVQGKKNLAVDGRVRALASIVILLPDGEKEAMIKAVATELGIEVDSRSFKTLRQNVLDARPLVDLSSVIKPGSLHFGTPKGANVVHMPRSNEELVGALAGKLAEVGGKVNRRVSVGRKVA